MCSRTGYYLFIYLFVYLFLVIYLVGQRLLPSNFVEASVFLPHVNKVRRSIWDYYQQQTGTNYRTEKEIKMQPQLWEIYLNVSYFFWLGRKTKQNMCSRNKTGFAFLYISRLQPPWFIGKRQSSCEKVHLNVKIQPQWWNLPLWDVGVGAVLLMGFTEGPPTHTHKLTHRDGLFRRVWQGYLTSLPLNDINR